MQEKGLNSRSGNDVIRSRTAFRSRKQTKRWAHANSSRATHDRRSKQPRRMRKAADLRKERKVLRYNGEYTQAKSLCCEGSDQPPFAKSERDAVRINCSA